MAKYDPDLYFKIELKTIRPEEVVPFSVHIVLQLNAHVVRVRNANTVFEKGFIDHLRRKGHTDLYILNSEQEFYLNYMNPPKTFNVDEEEAKAIAKGLNEFDEQKQIEAEKKAEDLLRKIVATSEEFKGDLLEIVGNPAAEHATGTAIYSILFAIALGKNDSTTLADIAVAALLHDIGLTQIDPSIHAMPIVNLPASALGEMSKHVPMGLAMLSELDYKPNKNVMTMIDQHHEKFDGTGYPKKMKGFRLDELAQAVAFADLCDTMMRGWWDGKTRRLTEAFEVISSIDKDITFPHYFNPELLRKVLKWMTQGGMEGFLEKASTMAENTKNKMLKAS